MQIDALPFGIRIQMEQLMKAVRLAVSIALAIALPNYTSAAAIDSLIYRQATVATPSTTGPICQFLGSQQTSSGEPGLQVRCAQGSTETSRVVEWKVTLIADDGRAVARSSAIRAVVTPALGQTSMSRLNQRLAFAPDIEIPQSLYQEAAERLFQNTLKRKCQVNDSRQIEQVLWEFRFTCA